MDHTSLFGIEQELAIFAIGLIIGYASAKFLTGKTPQIKFSIFHIHHWIWATIILIFLIWMEWSNPILIGIFTGVALEGLTYDDWSLFIKKEE
ncbi:MAG: hypothetical protein CMA03_01035 [Euryarchaeota archaeon]|nr:hypothetical protein [Euryarchaeota archaeon]|tara:strand:+ start:972 stop:1250 length:279 start_codon:yes stop_codon:yes gene_type:complete